MRNLRWGVRFPLFTAGAFVAVLMLVANGLAYAAIPGANGMYTACLNKDGEIRLIDAEASEECKRQEQTLVWSQIGPQGPAGPPGQDGQNGLDGQDGADGQDGVDGQDGAPGPQGEPGPASLDALQGTDCSLGELPGNVEVLIDPGTGVVTIVCLSNVPVAQDDSVIRLAIILGCDYNAYPCGLVADTGPSPIRLWARTHEGHSATLEVTQQPVNGSVTEVSGTVCNSTYCYLDVEFEPCDISPPACVDGTRTFQFTATDDVDLGASVGTVTIGFQKEFEPLDPIEICSGVWRYERVAYVDPFGELVFADQLVGCAQDENDLDPSIATVLGISDVVQAFGVEVVVNKTIENLDLDTLYGCDADWAEAISSAYAAGFVPEVTCNDETVTAPVQVSASGERVWVSETVPGGGETALSSVKSLQNCIGFPGEPGCP